MSAIYDHLETAINIEMDTGETTVRKMILEAAEESGDPEPLAPDSDDMDEWMVLVEALRDTILDDHQPPATIARRGLATAVLAAAAGLNAERAPTTSGKLVPFPLAPPLRCRRAGGFRLSFSLL